jgi:hypothetical protein
MTRSVARQLLKHDLKRTLRAVLLPLAPVAWLAFTLACVGLSRASSAALSAGLALGLLVAGVAALSGGVLLLRHLPENLGRGDKSRPIRYTCPDGFST